MLTSKAFTLYTVPFTCLSSLLHGLFIDQMMDVDAVILQGDLIVHGESIT